MRLILLIFTLLIFPNIVQAYVDPGSLSIIAQVIGSFFVGILVFFRSIKMYFLKFFYMLFPNKKKK